MTEQEMIDVLDDCIAKMEAAKLDVDQTDTFAEVGEWLLAFEGVYAAHLRDKSMFDADVIASIISYFELNDQDLSEIAQGSA